MAGSPSGRADGALVHNERHCPERTTLYRLVQQHAASFIAHTEASTGAELPRFVKDAFDAFLQFGILAHGVRQSRQSRQRRESAGLTLDELSAAVGLGDSNLIEQAAGGLVSLPFDVVLRLAGVLGRRDPLPVAMALTRQCNLQLWKTLEDLGVGRLVVQGARERELANVYRGNDPARALDDAQFARVLAFTRQAFEMAVTLHAPARRRAGNHAADLAP